jgi:endonuclease YncB( thermonuclease family)
MIGRSNKEPGGFDARTAISPRRAIGAKVWEKLLTATQPVWLKLRTVTGWVWGTLCAAAAQIWDKLCTAIGLLFGFLARRGVAGTLAAGGAMALGAAIGRYRAAGFDSEVVVMLAVAGTLIALLLPMALHGLIARFPVLAGPRVALAAVAVAVLAAGTAWFANLGPSVFASIGGGKEAGKEVVGRASVVAGDQLRVAGTTVRLSGIEVPEREQRCGKDNNKWRCAEAAQSALLKVISSRPVRCRLTGSDKAGRPLGSCWIDAVDINAELVRQGYVFAEGGTLARYSGQESEARNAKAGMWIGDTQRPAELRAKAWEEAKRNAPDGCPIKGQVTGQERVYVLPGTPDYQRVRVQTSRGDRWFCSEQEAAAAGFKEAQRG